MSIFIEEYPAAVIFLVPTDTIQLVAFYSFGAGGGAVEVGVTRVGIGWQGGLELG